MNPKTACWPLVGPLELIANTARTRTGAADPTGFVRDGRVWRAAYYPSGPASLAMWTTDTGLRAQAWGPGADEALAAVPALSGFADRPQGFVTVRHPVVHDLARRRPGLRLPRTESIFDIGVRAVLAQKVTGRQAKLSYQALARRTGVPAPLDRVVGRPLLLPPTPAAVLRALAGHGATALGIDDKRAAALRELALVPEHLAEWSRTPATQAAAARTALEQIPGVGTWTANEITATALGDPDAVPVGDYHVKNFVAFALTGEPRGTDENMVELLEPFRPHRARAVQLVMLSGIKPPRYGPRMDIPAHVPGPFRGRAPWRDAAARSSSSRSPRRTR